MDKATEGGWTKRGFVSAEGHTTELGFEVFDQWFSKLEIEHFVHIATGLFAIAHAIRWLGNADASTPMGGLEALGKTVGDSINNLASAMSDGAQYLRELADNVSQKGAAS